ncbi:hypothetical protein MVI01_63980 [Myxococcus virescens]|nr:hypothetical protein MVI01_63980 [Myxococcus virescens]
MDFLWRVREALALPYSLVVRGGVLVWRRDSYISTMQFTDYGGPKEIDRVDANGTCFSPSRQMLRRLGFDSRVSYVSRDPLQRRLQLTATVEEFPALAPWLADELGARLSGLNLPPCPVPLSGIRGDHNIWTNSARADYAAWAKEEQLKRDQQRQRRQTALMHFAPATH